MKKSISSTMILNLKLGEQQACPYWDIETPRFLLNGKPCTPIWGIKKEFRWKIKVGQRSDASPLPVKKCILHLTVVESLNNSATCARHCKNVFLNIQNAHRRNLRKGELERELS